MAANFITITNRFSFVIFFREPETISPTILKLKYFPCIYFVTKVINSSHPFGPTCSETVQRSKLVDERGFNQTRFNTRSRLSAYPFGVFCGFLRNSSKCGIGSLRKTSHGGHSTYRARS